LGFNLFALDQKGIASATTGQFGQTPTFNTTQNPATWSLTNLLNIFYYRPDLNLGAVLQDLATRDLLHILAEPNLLTVSGKAASFLAGGEFPFPTLQGGGAGVGQITIQFKEFGIRLNFLPTITPRGTIRLLVNPEVSSLDYANGLTVSGYTIPGLTTRRVQTEVELESGQSFVIAGLLNNQVTEQLSKMPGLAEIPLLGKLFQSRTLTKSNSELLVMVTPELVRPIPAGAKLPDVTSTVPFMKDAPTTAPQQPGAAITGPAPMLWKRDTLPIEELKSSPQLGNAPENAQPSFPGSITPPNEPLPGALVPGDQTHK
jgi:pilus assembly protein CpaC